VELSEENKRQLLVPRGFAHGFLTLEDDTIFAYKVDSYYSPECDRGIAYNDKTIGIDWILPTEELLLSDKDTKQPKLDEAQVFEYGINYYSDEC
jgi:dTDP-4-dehydrorhamnose 3,5-epimerase